MQVDYEMALEFATQSGVSEEPREAIYIQSLDTKSDFIEFSNSIFCFRLIR